jgi:tripartite-type tricarboxylate transporter receptor subunit TctC
MRFHFTRRALLACVALAATAAGAQGTDYPNKPIKIVVPLAAGGGVDLLGRALAERLTVALKQTFLVENRPGSAGNIGAEFVARSPADGYTLLLTGNSHTLNASLYKLRFDPRNDFVPVSHVVNTYQILMAHPSTGFQTVEDLVKAAKARPGAISYGSAGSGSPSHVAGVLFSKMAGVQLNHIPYKGAGPATNDVLGGQINLLFSSLPSAMPHVESGRIKALGVSSPTRTALAPQVPTIAESGLPGYQQVTWFGLLAPAGTPEAIKQKLSSEIANVLRTPEMQRMLAQSGMEPVASTPAAFNDVLESEFKSWPTFVKETQIRVE